MVESYKSKSFDSWYNNPQYTMPISGAFQLGGSILGSINRYKQAKENYNTALDNADEIRRYAEEVAQDLRNEQIRREASNVVGIAKSGLAQGSFTDLLREDILNTNEEATKQRNRLYAQASEMERKARKQKRKARDSKRLQMTVGATSAILAPFTGGASLVVGGAASGALSNYY